MFRSFILLMLLPLSIAAADPLYQSKGDQKRKYRFDEAGKDMPYRLYVPKVWEKGSKLPLVVMLHAAGMNENGPFDRAPVLLSGIVQKQAEEHGFIVVSPLGYSDRATFGAPVAPSQGMTQAQADRLARLSEKDVLNVIGRVTAEYGADPKRVYLSGNAGGMLGALYLAQKYPGRWAALALGGGGLRPGSFDYARLKPLKAAIFVRGGKDTKMPIEETRALSEGFRKQGVDVKFELIKGGAQSSSFYLALAEIFDFFDQHGGRAGK